MWLAGDARGPRLLERQVSTADRAGAVSKSKSRGEVSREGGQSHGAHYGHSKSHYLAAA